MIAGMIHEEDDQRGPPGTTAAVTYDAALVRGTLYSGTTEQATRYKCTGFKS